MSQLDQMSVLLARIVTVNHMVWGGASEAQDLPPESLELAMATRELVQLGSSLLLDIAEAGK